MTGERILVVEDDESILAGLELNLGMEGYQVTTAADGDAGLDAALRLDLDLVVLDVMLPRRNGLDILEALRRNKPDLPVIILSARDALVDKVAGLDVGADDYMTKPFGLPELLARINAALRRQRRTHGQAPAGHLISFGDVVIDTSSRTVTRSGAAVDLTARELDLLVYFARSRGRVLTREQILLNVWGDAYGGTDRTVDNFVARLRTKIERDAEQPEHLETVRGVGYRFKIDPRAP